MKISSLTVYSAQIGRHRKLFDGDMRSDPDDKVLWSVSRDSRSDYDESWVGQIRGLIDESRGC